MIAWTALTCVMVFVGWALAHFTVSWSLPPWAVAPFWVAFGFAPVWKAEALLQRTAAGLHWRGLLGVRASARARGACVFRGPLPGSKPSLLRLHLM